MDKFVRHRRVLIGLATLSLLVLLMPVRHDLDNILVRISALPAAMGLMLIEACAIGLVPLVLAFVAQLVFRDWELSDRVVLLCAVIVALAFRYWGHGSSGMTPLREALSVVFFALLLTWFGGLGAASARALRRNRRAKMLAPTSEA